MTPRGNGGFSLIELLLVLAILGVLVQIVVPNYRATTVRARAVDLVSEINVVAEAARRYESDRFEWPGDAGAGVVPTGMEEYLPGGFGFVGEDYLLDWENVPVPGGLPGSPGTDRILGVGVVTENEALGDALVQLLGATGWYAVGDSYVRIVAR